MEPVDSREKTEAIEAPVERGHDAWARAKIERWLAQAKDRDSMIPVERLLKGWFGDSEADARADADVAAGRLVSHDAVKRWVASLGSETPLPRPKPGD